MKAHRLDWLGLVGLGVGAALAAGCGASHEVPMGGDGGTDEPWVEDPNGLVGVSASDPRELLRNDFGTVRTVIRAEAPITSYAVTPDGARALLLLDEAAGGPLSALQIVALRDGALGPALRWAGVPDHGCASPDGRVSGLGWTHAGFSISCDTTDPTAPALALVDDDGAATGLAVPAECVFSGFDRDGERAVLRCDSELWWLDLASQTIVQRLNFDGVFPLRAFVTPDGGRLVLVEGDEGFGFVHVTPEAGPEGLVPLPPEIDVSTLSVSADAEWAFAHRIDDGATSTVFDTATGTPSAFAGCGDVANRVSSFSLFSAWADDAPRLVAACANGLWLGTPLEATPVRLGDAAYFVEFGPDEDRLLVSGSAPSTIVGLGGEPLGRAWPESPGATAPSWRRR